MYTYSLVHLAVGREPLPFEVAHDLRDDLDFLIMVVLVRPVPNGEDNPDPI